MKLINNYQNMPLFVKKLLWTLSSCTSGLHLAEIAGTKAIHVLASFNIAQTALNAFLMLDMPVEVVFKIRCIRGHCEIAESYDVCQDMIEV